MRDYLYNLATDKYNGFMASVIKFFLFLLTLIYGLMVKTLIFLSSLKPYRLNCKVISVGNITLGGTGKTTLVEYITRYLIKQGHKVAILTRGYKRKLTTYDLPLTTYENMGDEPYMLRLNLGDVPVLVNSNRINAGRKAIYDYSADSVILDDGFQQWKIKKDLEIVTIDATNPFGNGQMIPRGILREPLSSLKRADIIILTKTNLKPVEQEVRDYLKRINASALIVEAIHYPIGFYKLGKNEGLLDVSLLRGKSVTLVSGIGDPNSFRNLMLNLGINIGLSFAFPDHHEYSQNDLEKIICACRQKNIDTIVTTEKDAVRISNLKLTTYDLQLLILRIELRITQNEERFHNRLLSLYNP